MATAKKAPVTTKPATKTAAPKAAPKPVSKTATKAVKAPAKAPAKTAAKATKAVAAKAVDLKPIKTQFNKSTLTAHLAQVSGQEPKAVKAVVAALEATIVASLSKKGAGEFTLPGMLRVVSRKIPAKKARKGIDPFTKVERTFAAKPASIRLGARFMKKLKEAANG